MREFWQRKLPTQLRGNLKSFDTLTQTCSGPCRYMRTECLNHKYFYNSPMVTGRLVSDIADKHQSKTQASWQRPYGVGMLVVGVDVSTFEFSVPLNCNSSSIFSAERWPSFVPNLPFWISLRAAGMFIPNYSVQTWLVLK